MRNIEKLKQPFCERIDAKSHQQTERVLLKTETRQQVVVELQNMKLCYINL